MHFDSQWMAMLKVFISIILGAFIGLEREFAAKPAGLRTHMLVAGGSTLFVILGNYMLLFFADSALPSGAFTGDPIRIMQAIITGISFLGAGTIIFKDQHHSVEGLTTAASILFVSGIGMSVAIDKYVLAVGLTIVAIGILFAVGLMENWVDKMHERYTQ